MSLNQQQGTQASRRSCYLSCPPKQEWVGRDGVPREQIIWSQPRRLGAGVGLGVGVRELGAWDKDGTEVMHSWQVSSGP
jgi:hypothetical protein